MTQQTRKQIADKIRVEILTLNDEALINFAGAVYSGEEFKAIPLETVGDHVKRLAKEYLARLPF